MMKKLIVSALVLLGVCAKPAAAVFTYRYVQVSTATSITPPLQVGAMKVSSGTIQTFTATTLAGDGSALTNLSASGMANLLGSTNTWTAGQTFSKKITISSTVVDGSALQGTTGQALQSNAGSAPTWVNVPSAMLSTTSTWTASQIFSSATVTNLAYSTATVANNQVYSLYYSTTVCVANSSATTSSAYVPTNHAVTLTPKRTTSRIEVAVTGTAKTTNGNTDGISLTVFRSGTNVATALGLPGSTSLSYTFVASAVQEIFPAAMHFMDLPNTTSAITYTVYMHGDGGGGTVTWNPSSGALSCLTVKEWAY